MQKGATTNFFKLLIARPISVSTFSPPSAIFSQPISQCKTVYVNIYVKQSVQWMTEENLITFTVCKSVPNRAASSSSGIRCSSYKHINRQHINQSMRFMQCQKSRTNLSRVATCRTERITRLFETNLQQRHGTSTQNLSTQLLIFKCFFNIQHTVYK